MSMCSSLKSFKMIVISLLVTAIVSGSIDSYANPINHPKCGKFRMRVGDSLAAEPKQRFHD